MKGQAQLEKQLTVEQAIHLLNILKIQFEQNMQRHKAMQGSKIQHKLEASPLKCGHYEMERNWW